MSTKQKAPKQQTILRKSKDRENPYVMITRDVSANGKLSHKARGLMTYLLSLPDDWVLHMNELYSHFERDGRESTDSGIKELRQDGYITRVQDRFTSGTYGTVTYFIHEVPVEFPDVLETRKSTPRKLTPTVNGFSVNGEKEDNSTVNGFSVSGKPATTNNNTEGIIRPTAPAIFNSVDTIKSKNQSVSQSTDGLEEILKVLEDEYVMQLEIRPDILTSIEGAINHLFYDTKPTSISGTPIPPKAILKALKKLTPRCIENISDKYVEYSRVNHISVSLNYLKSMIYNSVYEGGISLFSDVNYNVNGNGRKSN